MKRIKLGLKNIFAPANDEAIVQSFLDTDFYKYPMGRFIYANPEYREARVKFKLIIRDKKISIPRIVPIEALREQLEAAQKLRLTQAEASFLGGMTLSDNMTHILPGTYLAELQKMSLPDFYLEYQGDELILYFWAPWWMVTWWEIFSMEIVSELYYFYLLKKSGLSEFEITAIYARMINKIHEKIQLIKTCPEVRYISFDTRRRHSRYLQEYVFEVSREELPEQCMGTSNVLLSMKHGSANPFGTIAHELTMVKAALAGDDTVKIKNAQYEIVEEWYQMFGPEMAILLIDTFGTKQFLENAPDWIAREYRGNRPDSMDPTTNIDMMVAWWKKHGVDPQTKIILPSDGLDAPEIVQISRENHHKVGKLYFGWGTLKNNDCRGIFPNTHPLAESFRPFSMACKVTEVNGVPAVKLSDNPNKATGEPKRVAMFKEIFGVAGAVEKSVVV